LNGVALVRSPIKTREFISLRTREGRGQALAKQGACAGTDDAVLLALRWLKKYQESEGKWTAASGGGPAGAHGKASPAMTGLALLTFLAHGETTESEEFGPTVERAIRWLIENQTPDGRFKESDGNEYSLPIAAYALAESFSLVKAPAIKDAAEKAIAVIVKGQHACGMWNYKCAPGDRNDTSYSGWCAQALKAAVMAQLYVDGLKEAACRAGIGFKTNYGPGGFGYTGPGRSLTLTGVGVLCMQLLGAGNDPAVRDGLATLEAATCDWQNPMSNALYAWYYITQAKFHAGHETWKKWDRQFAPTLLKNLVIVKNAIPDVEGRLVDIGYWPSVGKAEHGLVYNTTLCALQLTVYYRYLPTYKPPESTDDPIALEDKEKDIDVRFAKGRE
jgi:hypothetical protein